MPSLHMRVPRYRYRLCIAGLLAATGVLFYFSQSADGTIPSLEIREIPAPDRAEYRTTNMYPAWIKKGLGTATITPTSGIEAGRAQEYTFTFTVGDEALQPGDGLIILIPHCFSKPVHVTPVIGPEIPRSTIQKIGNMAGFTTAKTSNPATTVTLFCEPAFDTARLGEGSHLYVNVENAPLLPGETITVRYGDPKHGSAGGMSLLAMEFQIATFVYRQIDWADVAAKRAQNQRHRVYDTAVAYNLIANSPKVWVTGADAVKLIVTNPSDMVVGEPFDITVVARDRYDNLSQEYVGDLRLVPLNNIQETVSPQDNVQRDGVFHFGATASKPGIYRLEVRDATTGLLARGNPFRVHAGEPDMRVYWGDIHTHTVESDGLQTMSAAYRYARDVTDLDVCMITDHLNGVTPVVQQNADAYYAPERFVTFNAFERSGVAKGGGDMILYFRDSRPEYARILPGSDINREPNLASYISYRTTIRSNGVPEIVAAVEKFPEGDVIIIPHNHNGGPYRQNPAFNSPVVRNMEIFSVWGNSEFRETTDRPYHFGEMKRTWYGALAMGFRMGVVAGGDGHSGRPGWDNWLRVRRVHRGGLTAFPATGLTRDKIWNALWERRTYGTTGERNLLDVTLNGEPMGSTIRVTGANASRTLSVHAETTSAIRNVHVIKNNQTVYLEKGNGLSARFTWSDPAPAQDGDYYYIRVVQAGNHVTWSSPFWIAR